jgi:hypothetical protein
MTDDRMSVRFKVDRDRRATGVVKVILVLQYTANTLSAGTAILSSIMLRAFTRALHDVPSTHFDGEPVAVAAYKRFGDDALRGHRSLRALLRQGLAFHGMDDELDHVSNT